MTEYRIYRLDSARRVVWGWDFDCPTDDEALAEAHYGLRTFEKAEVWVGPNLIGSVLGPGAKYQSE
jgi:hypothetical protein